MKTFKLDEQSKKVLDKNIYKQLHLKAFNFEVLSEMVAQSMDIAAHSPQPKEQLYPSDGGRAGIAFKELAKLNGQDHFPGYAYFTYDQSFLRVVPTHLTPETVGLKGLQ